MRSVRLRIIAMVTVLLAAGVGGWQLLSPGGGNDAPIKVGTTDDVSGLDPAGAYDAGSWALYSNLYQSLMTFDPGAASPVPDAASRCGFVDETLRTYECELRDDLTFSSGRPLTAEDVKHSFDRVLAISSDVGPKSLFASLKSVRAEGLTVTFDLSSRDATFPYKVATGAGAIVDRAAYPARKLRRGDEVDGSGPYVLKSYEKGVGARLEPNPRYRGAVEQVKNAISVRYFKESEHLDRAWKAKKVDVTHRQMPPSVIARLAPGDPDLRINEAGGSEIRNLVFNVRKDSPLAERAVRQAAAALVDRSGIASSIYHGTVEPLYSLIPQGVTGHSTPFFDRNSTHDAAAARQLLLGAGVQTPVRIDLGYALGGAARQEAAELKRQLESGGLFAVRLVEKDHWEDFQADYMAGRLDAYTVGWVMDFPDPDNFSQPLVGSGNSLGNGYANREIDRLILDTQRSSERGRTAESFRKLQLIVARDVPLVPLWQKKDYVLSSKDVSGGQYLSDGTGVWRLWALDWL
ncbi:peptide-binding protein [Streptomyces agglomeratus]|uniref:Peptide-binding protein n=1 Tax=Streptomyces agglomeratus TaxID=285458 RepID=A0A1E5P794_9ACTN|nr:ABC transporter substrate-binding protein [Streptomyces agglomeratus]OEJ25389.1 peptide-binding protein [Streptomyces agglomeratus]OEJ40574.1 peptide-binding protein [Streptomyces agglomeratus]OEJ45045.1 peptide-binding protein [Streptomyces agglomeratus]OEJ53123.1 peptide-binding protein [Streptomyces agglomeratus]OEJ60459.1 peptide-binding protein [Streptomyces agglomeratus]